MQGFLRPVHIPSVQRTHLNLFPLPHWQDASGSDRHCRSAVMPHFPQKVKYFLHNCPLLRRTGCQRFHHNYHMFSVHIPCRMPDVTASTWQAVRLRLTDIRLLPMLLFCIHLRISILRMHLCHQILQAVQNNCLSLLQSHTLPDLTDVQSHDRCPSRRNSRMSAGHSH